MTARVPPPLPSAEYAAGSRWIAQHIDELVATHPNRRVAVYRGRVVGADAELGAAVRAAEQAAPADDIACQFIDDGTLIFLPE